MAPDAPPCIASAPTVEGPGGLPSVLPPEHRVFLERALPRFRADESVLGIAGAGSLITGAMDPFSDLDLVVVCKDECREKMAARRRSVIEGLGKLLSAFTGEHVGEPRLLICLFADPLLHVDVKFLSLAEFETRVEDPVVLWERAGELSRVIAAHPPRHPMPDPQWIEDRFWVWIHYAAQRLGRGELFETLDLLGFLRQVVFGPLVLVGRGHLPRGMRRLESKAPKEARALEATLSSHDFESCVRAVRAAIAMYRELRSAHAHAVETRADAEAASVAYLDAIAGAGNAG